MCRSRVCRSGAEFGRLRKLVGEERAEHALVDLGVKHGEAEPVGGEVVGVGVRASSDRPMPQAGEVVACLGHAVGDAEQSGHQGAQAPVGDAGDGAHGDTGRRPGLGPESRRNAWL